MKELVSLIERFEGMHKKLPSGLIGPYRCPAGWPTRGLGMLVKDMDVPPITEEEARAQLDAALPYYINETLKICPNLAELDHRILAAITDFVFNLGPARLRSSTLKHKLLAEDWEAVYTELRKWVNGGGKKLPGLVARREAEILLIKAALNDTE